MYLKILDPARLLYKDYSFYILLFLFLHNISNYINKTFDTIFFLSQGSLYSISFVFYYMDNNNGWWNKNKIIIKNNNFTSNSNLLIINLINTFMGYIIYKFILLNISQRNGLIHNNENIIIIIKDFTIIFFIFDFFFYFFHRLMHCPLLYKKIHKLHHQINANIVLSANYMTRIDYILEIILPYWLALYLYNP